MELETEAQLLKGVTSIYLHRGRRWLSFAKGYGLYATHEKLLGVRVSGTYRVMLLLPLIIRISAFLGMIIILVGLLQNPPQPSVFQFPILLLLVPMSILANYLPFALREAVQILQPTWTRLDRAREGFRDEQRQNLEDRIPLAR